MASDHQELLSFGQPMPGQPLHWGVQTTYLNSTETLLTDTPARVTTGTGGVKRGAVEHGHSYFDGKAVTQVG